MKHLYTFFLFALVTGFSYAQDPLVMIYEIDAQIPYSEFPAISAPGVNYTVNFGDGTILSNQTGPCEHTYAASGLYTVTVTGNFGRFSFFNTNAANQLKSVEQWGDNQWTGMQAAFYGCSYVVFNATDVPDLSQVTNMNQAFHSANELNQPLDNWDVSHVTTMAETFHNAGSFNQPLNSWDVSNVTDMRSMFYSCGSFNQPLDNWDTSSVTNMELMFSGAGDFNQNINSWDVSQVVTMKSMFSPAGTFNQPLDNWDTSSLTTIEGMFANSENFNQPINTWNTSSVVNMKNAFNNAEVFNQPLNDWDTSNVTNMQGIFSNNFVFNQPLNGWDVSNVTNMQQMFRGTQAFDQPLSEWDVSNATNISGMFQQAAAFNQDISSWQFNPSASFNTFVYDSGLDTTNYDALLNAFAQQQLQNKTLIAYSLEYCDAGVRNFLIQQRGWSISDSGVGPLCEGNTISGVVRFDQNNNGCDTADSPVNNFLVSASDGYYTASYSANDSGNYEIRVLEGTYTTTLLNVPQYFTVSPQQASVAFAGVGGEETVNFCLSASQAVQDLSIRLLPLDDVRPGFQSHYRLVAQNMGTQTMANATVTVTYDATKQSFVLANPAEASAVAGQITFGIDTLLPLQSESIDFTMLTATPPTVLSGDIATITATIVPNTADFTPQDNAFELNQVAVNAYDPNDKQVLQGETVHIDDADQYLDYIIRFQNTGTASAVNIRLLDVLDPKLDWSTFTPVGAKHFYSVRITDGNQVEILFNDIDLPDAATDEVNSHGFFAYKIKPISGIAVGDVVSGNAEIYFDFNAPIITNSVHTTIVDQLGVNLPDAGQLSVYPNPTDGKVNLDIPTGAMLQQVVIYNLLGNKIKSFSQNLESIDVSDLNSGVYLLMAKTDKGNVPMQAA